MTTFYSLKVARVEPETRDAVTITFAIPQALQAEYCFRPGQHLTLKARLGGEELRRCYSICHSRTPGEISVAVKACLLYTSDAADDLLCADLGGSRILKKKTQSMCHCYTF